VSGVGMGACGSAVAVAETFFRGEEIDGGE
jgi:hypothetical protein